MSRLKNLLLVMAVISILLLAGSCSKNDSSPTESATSSLEGTWVLTKITIMSGSSTLVMTPAQAQVESTITARADGTYSATLNNQGTVTNETGTWSTDGKKITFNVQDGTVTTLDYTINGNKLLVSETISTALGADTPANLEFTKQ